MVTEVEAISKCNAYKIYNKQPPLEDCNQIVCSYHSPGLDIWCCTEKIHSKHFQFGREIIIMFKLV